MGAIQNKYDFTVLFDVTNGNPNGDPDSGNMPRIDVETGLGLVTDGCIKRKIRDYVALVKEGQPGYGMYISSGCSLNEADLKAVVSSNLVTADPNADIDKQVKQLKEELKKLKKSDENAAQKVKEAACAMYYDVRTFGAVMTSYVSIGGSQIRGPVQLGFAKSIDPIVQQEVTITRCVHATVEEQRNKEGSGTMGNKYIVPYGLYRMDGYVSAALAQKYAGNINAGFSEDDLELFWTSVMNMFEHDRSASRGNMAVRKLIIFKHDSKYGSVPAHKLFDRVVVKRKNGVDVARSFGDYDVSIDNVSLPAGIVLEIRD